MTPAKEEEEGWAPDTDLEAVAADLCARAAAAGEESVTLPRVALAALAAEIDMGVVTAWEFARAERQRHAEVMELLQQPLPLKVRQAVEAIEAHHRERCPHLPELADLPYPPTHRDLPRCRWSDALELEESRLRDLHSQHDAADDIEDF